MPERRIKIPFPNPSSPPVDASEVPISESTEKWTEVKLEDGTIIRIKPNVVMAVRVDGQYDADGNPMYALKTNQTVTIVSSPEHLRRGSQAAKQLQ